MESELTGMADVTEYQVELDGWIDPLCVTVFVTMTGPVNALVPVPRTVMLLDTVSVFVKTDGPDAITPPFVST